MDRFTEIVEELQGTCKTMDTKDLDWLTQYNLLSAFSEELFSCEHCGWWCEISELAANDLFEQICIDCER